MDLTPQPADGPLIPFAPGWAEVPQGLGYDEEHEEFVVTFYDAADPRVGIIAFAGRDGQTRSRVTLRGLDHYGGVTTVGGRTYVSGRGRLQVHDTAALRRGLAEPLRTVRVRAASTVTSYRGSLHVARFRVDGPGTVWRYDLVDGHPVDTGEQLVAPPRTQGLSFDDDGHAWFSRSWGRATPSTLTRVSADDLAADGGWTPDNGADVPLPPMAEGSVIVDGRLHQLYESGALPYRRHRRAHRVLSWVRGPLRPRDRFTVHDVGSAETPETAPDRSP